jgi:MYXO-CTERM domain-containing protein
MSVRSPKKAVAASCFVLALLLGSNVARAQIPYTVTVSNGTWAPIGGTAHALLPYPNQNPLPASDEGYAPVPIGFSFLWYGRPYTTIYAYTNGFASFDLPPSSPSLLAPPVIVPDTQNPIHNFIGPLWQDLVTGPSGAITSALTGTAPSRVLTVQWANFQRSGVSTSVVNFQIRLHEGSNTLEAIYGPNNGIINGSSVAENADGTDGLNLLAPSATCPMTSCSCNPGNCTSASWPSGRTLTLTLPAAAQLSGSIAGPRGAYPSTVFHAFVRIVNVGETASGPFNYQVRLSTSNTSTAASTLLQTFPVPGGLAAGSVLSSTVALTMPAAEPPGIFYLALVIDPAHQVMEATRNNNLAFDTLGIATAPDLQGAITVPLSSGPGEPITAQLTVLTNGAPVTTPIHVAFFLSTDTMLDASDLPMGSASITLPGGFMDTQSIALVIPGGAMPNAAMPYHVLAFIDDTHQYAELDETNNVAASGPITLRAADLEASGFSSGDFAFLGLPYPVQALIKNSGGATATNFTVCIAISRTRLISLLSSPILSSTPPMTLHPGEQAMIDLAPVISTTTATGTWYAGAVANCSGAVFETDEANNISERANAITVRPPGPDFTPAQILTSSIAAAGETIPVTVDVQNIGNAAGSVPVRIVISTTPTITAALTSIYDSTTPLMVPASMDRSISVWAQLPGDLSSGTYYVGVVLDPQNQVDEIRKDNNTAVSAPLVISGSDLAIVTPPLPPAIIGVPFVRRFNGAGGTQPYVWTLTWANGMMPTSLSFDAPSAELHGTPVAADEGRYDFTVHLVSGSLTADKSYRLVIAQPTIPLSIVSTRLPPAIQNEPYTIDLSAVGGVPAYQWAAVDMLPHGLGLSATGQLAGMPNVIGAYTFKVSVTDVSGAVAQGLLSLDVIDPNASLTITTADIPTGVVGMGYETTFTAAGGTEPYTWMLESMQALPGLSFDPSKAQLVGTPTVAGEYPIIVEVLDKKGLLDRNAYVLQILAPGDIQIVTGSNPDTQLPAGKVGKPYANPMGMQVSLQAMHRGGGDPGTIHWTVVDGMLPPGIMVDGNSGTFSGTPTMEGNFPFRVMVTNESGDFAFAALVMEIDGANGSMPVTGVKKGCGCSSTRGASSSGGVVAVMIALAFALRRRRALIVGAAVLGLERTARADPIPYQVSQTTAPYVPLVNGTPFSPPLGDQTTVAIALPFDFYLYGTPYRTLYVNANGVISVLDFGPGHDFPPLANPQPGAQTGFVAGLWDDWCSDAVGICSTPSNPGQGTFYAIDTTTPGEASVSVEYRHIRSFDDQERASDFTFKIMLHEGPSGLIEVSFGQMAPGLDFFGNPTSFRSRMGVENAAGTAGQWVGPCAGANGCSATDLAELAGQKITLVEDSGADLTVAGLSVPSIGYPGLPLPVTTILANRHGATLGPTTFAGFLLPASSTSTSGALHVYESSPFSLAAFETRTVSFGLPVPNDLQIGQYRVAVFIDDQNLIAETDEHNNVAVSNTSVRIADRAPDFRVASVRPMSSTVSPGQTLIIAYTAGNYGNEPGPLDLQAYLSSNDFISISDVPIGPRLSFDTHPEEVVTGTISAPIPAGLATGAYWVGIVADPEMRVMELFETNNVGTSTSPILVSSSALAIVTASLPPATLGEAYSGAVRAGGGSGMYGYRLADGVLPRGTNFDAINAEVFGIPLETGSFPLTFEVSSGSLVAQKQLALMVTDPDVPLRIVTRDLPAALLANDYAVTIRAAGGREPYNWRIASGSMPPGLVLASDGTVLGTPTSVGGSTFTVQAEDARSSTSSVTYTLYVDSPGNLIVVSSDLPDAILGQPYLQGLLASGGQPPIHWRSIDDPPPGIVLSSEGMLDGVPEKIGSYRFGVEATDSKGNVDTNNIFIVVRSVGDFAIATDTLPDGTNGKDYRAVIKASGGASPITWEIARGEGALPQTFTAMPSDGTRPGETSDDLVIAGRFIVAGVWAFTVRATDAEARVAEKPLAITAHAAVSTLAKKGCGCETSGASSTYPLWTLFLVAVFVRIQQGERR